MPHGAPDFSNRQALSTIFAIFDLGEAVARLGSIDYFDRRGNVLFMDSFEDGDRIWRWVAGGVGAAQVLSTTCPKSGSYCRKLTTGSADGDRTAGQVDIPFPVLSNMGFEASVSANTQNGRFYIYITVWDGVKRTYYIVRYDFATRILSYLDSSGSWVTVSTSIDLTGYLYRYHVFKLRLDLVNRKYINLLVNSHVVNLANLSGQEVAHPLGPVLRASFLVEGDGAANRIFNLDDVIITQNEP